MLYPADSIEANVENAEVHVERGGEQLQRAAYYQVSLQPSPWVSSFSKSLPLIVLSLLSLSQQKSRKKMCILAMVCSIVLVILSIIIWQAAKWVNSAQPMCHYYILLRPSHLQVPAWNHVKNRKEADHFTKVSGGDLCRGVVDVENILIWTDQACLCKIAVKHPIYRDEGEDGGLRWCRGAIWDTRFHNLLHSFFSYLLH